MVRKVSNQGISFSAVPIERTPDPETNPFVKTLRKADSQKQFIPVAAKTGPKIVPVTTSDDLAARVDQLVKRWDFLAFDEQADSLIDLEDRVAVLTLEGAPEAKRI